MRIRVVGVVCLWLFVLASALGVVSVTYQTRVATDTLETLRHQAADLHVQSGQYLLERSTLAAYARIEDKALHKLGMTVPDIETVVIIRP